MKTRKLKLKVGWSCGAALLFLMGGCSVDFDGFVYDDDAFEEAQSGGASGDGDGSGGRAEGNENDAFCPQFCADSAVVCPFGAELGYADEDQCTSACATFDSTALECRLVELGKAEGDPEQHCPATLMDGGGICPDATPDVCSMFCAELGLTCAFGGKLGYATEDECINVCEGLDKEAFDCRKVHLGFAQKGDPIFHCPHTLADGGGICPDVT